MAKEWPNPLVVGAGFSLHVDEVRASLEGQGDVAEPTVKQSLVFSQEALESVTETLGLKGVERVAAEVVFSPAGPTGLRVKGSFEAAVREECGLSLEPFDTVLAGALDRWFDLEASATTAPEGAQEVLIDLNEEGPEPLIEGFVPLFEMIQEEIELARDPHPRKPGLSFEAVVPESARTKPTDDNPFEVLRALKRQDEEGGTDR